MDSNLLPLVSCICVTYQKPLLLKRAINCFLAQTYPNKQLIILYEDHDSATYEFIKTENLPASIKVVKVPGSPKETLGTLRNTAIDEADGLYVCQWDDDDWYHNGRLLTQYEAIIAAKVSGAILTQWLVFDGKSGRAFKSNVRNWEGSIMCKKDLILEKGYDNVARGEDTSLIDYLVEKNCLTFMNDMAGLYIYVYHGSNTWAYNHFNEIFDQSEELFLHSECISEILKGIIPISEASLLLSNYLIVKSDNVTYTLLD
ncbi:glycosyltransferase family 2 protein [Pedobacter sp. MR22-3]|uniref:glycosyltransferase family 2 protein n=1 Tax=Pedobacter TaxID=84567 RepID=UPI002245940E|nr:glycosyltransferase family A protein [Pedobacter sp. MR22-3]MCX2584727.1 glycosyltransferase family A protein [Pedobacter sp. MR22-3]